MKRRSNVYMKPEAFGRITTSVDERSTRAVRLLRFLSVVNLTIMVIASTMVVMAIMVISESVFGDKEDVLVVSPPTITDAHSTKRPHDAGGASPTEKEK